MSSNNTTPEHEAIKYKMDIVEVISHFVPLKKKGREHVSKCPFHNEHTPSFGVNSVKGLYKCFGCGVSGDAIKFVMEHEKLDYKGAMQWLGDFYNMPVNDTAPRPATNTRPVARHKPEPDPTSYISKDIFNKTLTNYESNNLVKFLHTLFEPETVNTVIEKYYIGTSKYYPGGCIFWQVDEFGNIRSGKIMPYNPDTGKRNRQAVPLSNWVHSVLKLEPFHLQQCFFGQHLLNDDISMPVAVVESEKTAIIASVFIPSFVWIATGGKAYDKHNIKGEINEVPEQLKNKFKALAGRKVVLFPDLGAGEDWKHLATQLADITTIIVNDILQSAAMENNLPEKSDLCDYLTSAAARAELIQSFKTALITQAPQTIPEGLQIWEEYKAIGLRLVDAWIATAEIRQEYEFDSEGLIIIPTPPAQHQLQITQKTKPSLS